MPNHGIVIQNLQKQYALSKTVLNGLSLEIPQGDIFGVIGPNGSGKTTLMSCILGLIRWQQGTVLVDGFRPDEMAFKKQVGFLPERLNFDRWMSGYHFVAFHHELSGMPSEGRLHEVEGLLERVGLESEAWERPLRKYSRGMLQRIGLAQALAGRPRYLMLDEPTSGMDPEGALRFRKIIKDFAVKGGTVLINSHQLEQVSKVCDAVGFVQDGRIREIRRLDGSGSHTTLAVRFPPNQNSQLKNLFSKKGKTQAFELVFFDTAKAIAHFKVEGDLGAAALARHLIKHDIDIIEMINQDANLESLFDEGRS